MRKLSSMLVLMLLMLGLCLQPVSAYAEGEDNHDVSETVEQLADDHGHDHEDHDGESHADHDDHADHGHGDHDTPPLLSVDPGSAVWNLIVFLLLLVVLGKFVWPNILAGLKTRDEKIREDLQQAEDANQQAQSTLAEYKAQLADAQKEYQRVVDEARKDAQAAAATVKAAAEKEMQDMKARAAADIQSAKQQALSEIYEQTAVLATDVAGRILQREINSQDHDALIRESLSQIGSNAN